MDNWVLPVLAGCGIFISFGMMLCMFLVIRLLWTFNKISGVFSKTMNILNFEARIIAPLVMGKKLFDTITKRASHQKKQEKILEELNEEIRSCEECDNDNDWHPLSLVKWGVLGVILWKFFRRHK